MAEMQRGASGAVQSAVGLKKPVNTLAIKPWAACWLPREPPQPNSVLCSKKKRL